MSKYINAIIRGCRVPQIEKYGPLHWRSAEELQTIGMAGILPRSYSLGGWCIHSSGDYWNTAYLFSERKFGRNMRIKYYRVYEASIDFVTNELLCITNDGRAIHARLIFTFLIYNEDFSLIVRYIPRAEFADMGNLQKFGAHV